MKLTWIDLNSWLFHLAGLNLLVDPWLVDPMVFYGQPWLFTARHQTPPAFTPATLPPIDCILLAQGVDDHCHIPTLKQLDRSIPVVASPTAAKIVQKLGYQTVISLRHWQTHAIADQVTIQAIPGAEIQPGQVENGYLLTDLRHQQTVYYEPHSFPTQAAPRLGKVDVAIAPAIGQVLPLLGQVIMGPQQTLAMLQALQPQFFLPTTRGEIETSGILPNLLKTVGSIEELQDKMHHAKLSTQLVIPQPGIPLELAIAR